MNDFDDNMKKRAGDFRIEPREQVWERITHELDGKKRKRRAIWFWWLVPLVIAGGGIAIYQGGSSEEAGSVDTSTVVTPPAPAPTLESQQLQGSTTPHATQSTTPSTDNLASEQASPISIPTPGNNQSHPVRITPDPEISPAAFSSTSTSKVPAQSPPEATIVSDHSIRADAGQIEILKDTIRRELVVLAEEKAPEAVLSVEENTPGPDSIKEISQPLPQTESLQPTNADPQGPKQTKKMNPARWTLLAGIGMHNHARSGISLEKSMVDFNSGSQNNAGGGFSNSQTQLEPTKAGAGFMLGMERSQPFGKSKHWSWMAGLHYQYQTVNYTTGPRKDSILVLESDMAGRSTTASYYARPGSTQEQRGSQHRAHLLAAVQWHFDNKQKWTWQNGFYGGMVLANDYLLPQSPSTGWIPSNGLTKTGYFGMETGIKFQPGTWGAGLFGQYNLSSSVNVSGLPAQYWRGLELRVHYQLSSSSSKK